MRALDRLISFVFSVIMLVVSVVLVLVGIGVVEPQMIMDMLGTHVFAKEVIAGNAWNTLTIVGIVLFLASLKTTIFLSLFKNKDKTPILVKTENGEVEIAQETITNTVRSVGVSFENIKDVQAKMVKKRKGVIIYAVVLVYTNSNIRAITEEMQSQVKEVIKATTGVSVLEVNIKVKNIYQKPKKNDEPREITAEKETVVSSNENVSGETEEVLSKEEENPLETKEIQTEKVQKEEIEGQEMLAVPEINATGENIGNMEEADKM